MVSKPANLSGFRLTSVELEVDITADHQKGDVAQCVYEASNREKIVFTQNKNSTTIKLKSTAAPEITVVNRDKWDNSQIQNEFVCTPSSTNACKLSVDQVNALEPSPSLPPPSLTHQ